jgi:hypothetical protein
MIAQVRIYTVNRGMMDDWLKVFNEKLAPIHAKYGIKIVGAWVQRQQNEFVWVRSFADAADRDARISAYNSSPERRALGDLPGTHLAKLEVREVEDVFAPAATPA